MGELESAASLSVGTVESDIVRCYGAGPAGFSLPPAELAGYESLSWSTPPLQRTSYTRPFFLWAAVDIYLNLFTS